MCQNLAVTVLCVPRPSPSTDRSFGFWGKPTETRVIEAAVLTMVIDPGLVGSTVVNTTRRGSRAASDFFFSYIRLRGLRVQGTWCRVQGAGCRVQGSGNRVQGTGCRVQGAGCRVQGAGCRMQGAGCRVQGALCRVEGSGLRTRALVEKGRETCPKRRSERLDILPAHAHW